MMRESQEFSYFSDSDSESDQINSSLVPIAGHFDRARIGLPNPSMSIPQIIQEKVSNPNHEHDKGQYKNIIKKSEKMCKKADIMQWSSKNSKNSKRSLKRAVKKVRREEQAWRSIYVHADKLSCAIDVNNQSISNIKSVLAKKLNSRYVLYNL